MSDSIHLKYLAINQNDLKWGMAVNSVGYQEIKPGMPYPPGRHPSRYLFSVDKGRVLNEYQLIYITQGQGRFTSKSGSPTAVREGNLFLLFPGEWHSYHPDPKTGWKEYWIGFNGREITTRDMEGFFTRESPVLEVGLRNDIVELYEKAITVASEQQSGFQQMLAGIVDNLLGMAYFYNRNHTFKAPGISEKINEAKHLIHDQYSSITPQKVADELFMSYSNFRKVFKQYTGFSPAQYIQDVRMNKAKEILTNTTLTVKEIAFSQGYENYEYFLTAFRAKTGVSPSEYREVTQGKKGDR